jgi:hypothetical protein
MHTEELVNLMHTHIVAKEFAFNYRPEIRAEHMMNFIA